MEMPLQITILLFVLASFLGATGADDDASGLCKFMNCGKGTCNSTDVVLGIISIPSCQCNSGWKKPLWFPFAPCVLPNCTLDATCSPKTPSSAPSAGLLPDISTNSTGLVHPCAFSVCGSGSCKTTSQYGYSCVCDEGYENLLNMTSAPCVRECSIGADCMRLGINVPGSPASPPPSQADKSDGNKGCGSESPYRIAMAIFSLCILFVFRNPLL